MSPILPFLRRALPALACAVLLPTLAQPPGEPPPGADGPPRFAGPGGNGRPGGMGGVQEKQKLVKQFDRDGDKRLNAGERKAALEFLGKQGGGRGQRGPGGFRGPGQNQEPAQPGAKVSPDGVKIFPDAPLFSPQAFRTFFLEFENDNWEKELAAFKNTDVEVTAKLIVDGKTYPDVGVSFHGMSSFMMVGESHKRSLNVSLDYVHADQRLGGYRTIELLNSHEDPTFLRTVLSYQIEREYLPAPKANFARVVINGESWGVYVNAQTFNKEFVKDWYDTTKGTRWKVPGSPNGQGSLAYLGDDPAAYKRIYDLKSKEDAKSWTDLIRLCKVLNETPADQLEAALAPLLDVDGALKFLALENALINNDGYWVRSSDYVIYQDTKGVFHVLPRDSNETFLRPGGPGGPGGGGPGGQRGGMMFGPGGMLARQMTTQADVNGDQKVSGAEFAALANKWFDRLDPNKSGAVSKDQFAARFSELLPEPEGGGPRGNEGPGGGPPGGFRPGMFIAPGMFGLLDADQDGSLKRAELKSVFAQWFTQWDTAKAGSLNEESLRTGLSAALPRPEFGGPGGGGPGGPGGPGMRRGPGGPGMGGRAQVKGVELDPLVAAKDTSKPLISKLLAVPALRERYLGYVRDIAEKWLDWNKLGPIATQYHALIAEDVKADTRKLDSTEAFLKGLTEDVATEGPGGNSIALKRFAEQRRAYLLNLPAVKNAAIPAKQ